MESELKGLKEQLDHFNSLRDDDPIHLAYSDQIGEILEDTIDLDFQICEKTNYLESFMEEFLGIKQDEPDAMEEENKPIGINE